MPRRCAASTALCQGICWNSQTHLYQRLRIQGMNALGIIVCAKRVLKILGTVRHQNVHEFPMGDVASEGKPIVANMCAAVGRSDSFSSDQLIRRFVIANGVVAWRGETFAKRCSYYCP